MDLIKNYGSYENAKAELDKIKSTKYRNYMYLEEALLEYRRANNIFEVGDKVIWCDEDFCIVDKVYTCGMIGIDAGYERFRIGKHNLRHATDQEIKAGHRINNHELEELELVDVGPNCKNIGKA